MRVGYEPSARAPLDAHGATPEYDPLQFERWLNDVAMLLDRCLAYRREYNDLVGSAVRQALEYDFFNQQKASSEALEKATWVEDLKRAEAVAQGKAAAQFDKDAKAPLASGFAETARGGQSISIQTADSEATRKDLVSTRWKAYIDYQDQLEARHTAPGHPLNFAQRALRVKGLLLEDLKEAASKYHSAAAGIFPIFGFVAPEDYIDSREPLDVFVNTVRTIARDLEKITQNDVSSEWVAEVQGAPSGATLQFAISPPSLKFVRVQGLAVSIDLKNLIEPHGIPNPLLLRASVTVTPWGRSPFTFNNVAMTHPSNPPKFLTGKPFFNWYPDPKTGRFMFSIFAADNIGSSDANLYNWNDRVERIVFRFLIVGQPLPNPKITSSKLEVRRIEEDK
jgi:hypothetical protein